MAVAVAMPSLGMSMREGRVLAWLVPVGARVAKDQPLLSIESEKAEFEMPAPAAGVLRHVYVEPDATVPCGTLLAVITASGDAMFDADAFRRANDRPLAVRPAPVAAAPGAAALPARERVAITPAARARARTLGIDAAAVAGTGPGGRITRDDIEAWAARRQALVEVAPGVSLEAPAQGAGEPVVLLPGFGVDVSVFTSQVPSLAERFRVIGVNPRGVGLSDAPAAACYDVATAAADAAALLGRPAHIVGASLGAAVALELALAHPESVRSLVLITPFVTAGARLLAVLDAWCRVARAADSEALASVLLPWMFSECFLADAASRERARRGLAASAARVAPTVLDRYAAGVHAWSGSRAADLGRIAVPTLVVTAAQDLLVPAAATVGAAIPGAVTRTLPTAGHAVTIEAAAAMVTMVLGHLGGV